MNNANSFQSKTIVKHVVMAVIVRLVAFLQQVPFVRRTYFILPPADPGCLGDQAWTQAVQDWVKEHDDGIIRQVLIRGFRPQTLQQPDGLPLNVSEYSFLSQVKFVLSMSRARAFFVLGTDILDGRHVAEQSLFMLRLCELSARAGVSTTVLGSSFSEHPQGSIVECIRKLPDSIRFNLRDNISHERFEKFTGRAGIPVADLAFLLRPRLDSASAKEGVEWAKQQRHAGHRVIGVNINVLTSVTDIEGAFKEHGGDIIDAQPFEDILGKYAEVLTSLEGGEGSCRFLLIPHDFRHAQSDLEALRRLQSRLPDALAGKTFCLGDDISAWDVKAVVQECDLVFTARMHLAIAALGMCVPVVCLSYVGKFQGLLDFFEMSDFCFDSEKAWSAANLVQKIEVILGSLPVFQERISMHLPQVKKGALRNFQA